MHKLNILVDWELVLNILYEMSALFSKHGLECSELFHHESYSKKEQSI